MMMIEPCDGPFFDEEKRAHKQGKRGVGAPQLRSLLKSLTGAEPTFAETFGMLKGRETLTCDDFVAIYSRGSWMEVSACAALSKFDQVYERCAALPDGGSGD